MAIVDELVTLLGLKTDPKAERNAKGFNKLLDGVTKMAVKAGTALVALQGATTAWVSTTANAVDAGGKLADSIGVSYESLQELGFATERAGGSVSELNSDLVNLTQSMASPIPGEFNQNLALMGISVRKANGELRSADDVLGDLAGKFENVNAIQAQQLGKKLGLSQSTIKLLQQGQDGIAGLRAEARALGAVVPEEAKKDAADYVDAITNIKAALTGISRIAAMSIAPAMKDAMVLVQKFLATNRQLIRSGLTDFAKGVTEGFSRFFTAAKSVWDIISGLLGPVGDFIGGMDRADVVTGLVATALSLVAGIGAIFAAKFIAIGAAVGGALLVLEDLLTWFRGGDSVIGRFVDSSLEKVHAFIETFKSEFPALADFIETVFTKIGEVMSGVFEMALTAIKGTIEGMKDAIFGVFDSIKNLGMGALEGLESAASWLGFGKEEAAAGSPSPMAYGAPGTTTNNARGGDTTVNVTMQSTGSVAGDIAKAKRGFADMGRLSQTASPGLFAPVAG